MPETYGYLLPGLEFEKQMTPWEKAWASIDTKNQRAWMNSGMVGNWDSPTDEQVAALIDTKMSPADAKSVYNSLDWSKNLQAYRQSNPSYGVPAGSTTVTPEQVAQMRAAQAAGGMYDPITGQTVTPQAAAAQRATQQNVYGANYASAADMLKAISAYGSGASPAAPVPTPAPAPVATATQVPMAVATQAPPTAQSTLSSNLPAAPYTRPAAASANPFPTSHLTRGRFKIPNLTSFTQRRWSNFPSGNYAKV